MGHQDWKRGPRNDHDPRNPVQAKQAEQAAGKRTRTAGLSRQAAPAPAPVQAKASPAAEAAQATQAATTQQWLDIAVRPDLYTETIQRQSAGAEPRPASSPAASPAGGSGQAMPDEVRAKMEDAFGADFSSVQIHEGARAESVGALAYTQGTDIHFAPGQYQPQSQRGQELLGHELAHVVQQSQGRVSATTQAKGVNINDDASLEREADEKGARAARGASAGGAGATARPGAGQAIQRFVPKDSEQAQVTTELDRLLGSGIDPGGIRAAIILAPSDLGALQTAIDTVVNTAAVPLGDRAGLLNDLGNDITLLASLLTVAMAPSGAGSPAVRLRRVLDANPSVARTLVALTPLIEEQKSIDDKILRGRITGGALGANEKPTGEKRALIGGHSPELLNEPGVVLESSVTNPNNTKYVGFRKLLRADAPGFAHAIANNLGGNLLATVTAAANTANLAAQAAPPPVNKVPVALQTTKPDAYKKATEAYTKNRAAFDNGVLAADLAYQQLLVLGGTIQTAAPAAANQPAQADQVKPFIDAMTDFFASADALVNAVTIVDPTAGAAAKLAIDAARDQFERTGPVLSTKKNSTLAPAGMSDDDVLRAGDQTAATTPTLIRQDSTGNNPVSGSQVETKHQLVINGMVWVAMKEGVTITKGPPHVFTGGKVISSYPTSLTAIPADPVHPNKDPDRFSTVP